MKVPMYHQHFLFYLKNVIIIVILGSIQSHRETAVIVETAQI